MTDFLTAEAAFLLFVEKNGMLPHMKYGCVLGLSGGADSVLLLLLAERLAKKEGFPLSALHVHHGIRGEEAERDLLFARALCFSRGVPFYEHRANVPALAAERGEGIEEAARRVRYEALCDTAHAVGAGAVLTAHHAGDFAETVLLNLARGTGGRGLCGIPAKREENGVFLLRPLLPLTREQIEKALSAFGADYVNDSTNGDLSYRRNFVRHELVERFRTLNPAFEKSLLRMSEALASDMDYLDAEAKCVYLSVLEGNALPKRELLSLHPALAFRVLLLLYREHFPFAPCPEKVHTDAFFERLSREGAFSLAFPAGIHAVLEGEKVRFLKNEEPFHHARQNITLGENILSDGAKLLVLEKGSVPENLNVYNLSIHRDVSSATINGGLYVRERREGDSYRFGGVTHKLKKLLSDAKLTRQEREHTPVLCDEDGILWVPRFGVRNDGVKNGEKRDLTLYYIPTLL